MTFRAAPAAGAMAGAAFFQILTQIKNEFGKKWDILQLSPPPLSKMVVKNVSKIRVKNCGYQILCTKTYSIAALAQKKFCTKMATTFLLVKIFGKFFFSLKALTIDQVSQDFEKCCIIYSHGIRETLC